MDYIIIFCAELLGAKYFKKYWPIGGAYWNRAKNIRRLDPTNKLDLEQTIVDTYSYTQGHVQGLVIEFIIFIPCIFLASDPRIEVLYTYIGMCLIHLYALLIHQYNRILARRKLASIKDEPVDPLVKTAEVVKVDPYQIEIIDICKGGAWYRLAFIVRYCEIYFGPYFISEAEAIKYREQLQLQFGSITHKDERAAKILNHVLGHKT